MASCSKEQKPLEITFANQQIVPTSSFGLTTSARAWDSTAVVSVVGPTKIVDDYQMVTGKRLHCHNEADGYVYTLTNANGDNLFVDFREYQDGFAFR